MAGNAVARQGVSIALACRTFGVSETCYRYSPLMSDENEEIADLLVGLTNAKKNWGFGLGFLYLRNVHGRVWNHKPVYRIYCGLELNLRIKPRKRLKRDKPDTLAVPDAPNITWSMDFMADRLGDGRLFRLLNLLDDFLAVQDQLQAAQNAAQVKAGFQLRIVIDERKEISRHFAPSVDHHAVCLILLVDAAELVTQHFSAASCCAQAKRAFQFA